jgi:hypothetical protein
VDLFKKRVSYYIIGAIIRSEQTRAFKNQRKSIQEPMQKEPTQEHQSINPRVFQEPTKSIRAHKNQIKTLETNGQSYNNKTQCLHLCVE